MPACGSESWQKPILEEAFSGALASPLGTLHRTKRFDGGRFIPLKAALKFGQLALSEELR
jgi:hypothetical protein